MICKIRSAANRPYPWCAVFKNDDTASTLHIWRNRLSAKVPTKNWPLPKRADCLSVNLEGDASRETRRAFYVNMSWNVLDMAARYNVAENCRNLDCRRIKIGSDCAGSG